MDGLRLNIENDNLAGINETLKSFLERLTGGNGFPAELSGFESSDRAEGFRGWLLRRPLAELGGSLAVRCLRLVGLFPSLADMDYLYGEFLFYMNRTDLFLNPPNRADELIFSSLIEVILGNAQCPSNESEFAEAFSVIKHDLRRKIETLTEQKRILPEKADEYARLFHERSDEYSEKGAQLLFDILLTQTELRRFFLSGLNVPIPYLVYFIALDESGHFSTVIRQSALSAIHDEPRGFLWNKLSDLRGDSLMDNSAAVLVCPDTTAHEFACSIIKILRRIGAGYDYGEIIEIARGVLETMPESRAFLHDYPLAVSAAPGDDLLTVYWYSLSLKTISKTPDGPAAGRYVKLNDYTVPNSRGVPAALFMDRNLALPFIRREYLRYTGIENEAEIRLRCPVVFKPPEFVKARSAAAAKKLIETNMAFLEMYAQQDSCFESQGGQRLTRDDLIWFLDRNFDLSLLNAESLLHAKIMLWYIEPIQSIFNINNATEEALARINEYIEGIYGKPLSVEAAVKKTRSVIDKENENIVSANNGLDEPLYKPPAEGSPLWTRLFNILVQKYTRRNTLTLWELRGILYDTREQPPPAFYNPALAAFGGLVKRALSRAVRAAEKEHPKLMKARKWLYNSIYDSMDKSEKALDACGWKEQEGECLRRDRQCCAVPFPSLPCAGLSADGCKLRSLSCKFWLCSAARSRLAATRKGRRFLARRRFYSFLCQAFNVPVKVRCSFHSSFDDKSTKPLADMSKKDWYDKPL